MIYQIKRNGQKIATSWRDDCFGKAVSEARRQNNANLFAGKDEDCIGVYQDTTGRFAAVGISRGTLAELIKSL